LLNSGRLWGEKEAIDYLSEQPAPVNKDTVLISVSKKWGLTRLLELISQILPQTVSPV